MTPEEQELVTDHLALVHSIARKVKAQLPQFVDYEELVSNGQEGLIQAARRYDPERGVAFATFAYYRIRGAIFDSIRRTGPMVRVGSRLRFEEKADRYLEQQAQEPQPANGVAAAERLSKVVSDLTMAYVLTSDRVGERADPSIPNPSDVAEAHEGIALIRERLANLPEKERELIRLMYFEDLPMQEAGRRLGMSKGWASRLHARALAKLRKEIEAPRPGAPMIRV